MAQNREYQGVSPEEVYRASEKVFELADKEDVSLTYKGGQLLAQRRYHIMMMTVITEQWEIEATQEDGATHVNAFTSKNWDGHIFYPESTNPYQVFWARLDYLLGKASHWVSCENVDTLELKGSEPTDEWWCPFADDEVPDGPLTMAPSE